MLADGQRQLVLTDGTDFNASAIGSKKKYSNNNVIVMNKLTDLEINYPSFKNLKHYTNASDLLKNDKFSALSDNQQHVIIGIKEMKLTHFNIVHKPKKNYGTLSVSLLFRMVCLWV